MLKHSKQRDSIKDFLKGRTDHPTAETVYTHIRESIPNISLATVYRNLTLLTNLGEIRRLHTGDGPDHFDGNVEFHDHFICRGCGKVIDLMSEEKPGSVRSMDGSVFGGMVESRQAFFYGLCPDCLKKSPEDRDAAGFAEDIRMAKVRN